MSIQSKIIAGAATLTLFSGVTAAAAMSAAAATPSCGSACVDLFSREFGTHHTPAFVLDVFRQGAKVGQPLILFRTSNTDPAEDINASFQGTTSDFYSAGLVSSAVELHYGGGKTLQNPAGNSYPDDPAFELEYTPFGVGSGLCVGVPRTAAQNTKVALEPCGRDGRTVWIVDTGDSVTVASGYVPLVNGSDTNFSHPFVLTYPKNAEPWAKPRAQLVTQNLTGFTGNLLVPILGTINDNQLWGANFGVNR